MMVNLIMQCELAKNGSCKKNVRKMFKEDGFKKSKHTLK